MKKHLLLLILAIIFCDLGIAQYTNVIDPELQELINNRDNELISINIILKSQIDVKKLNHRGETFSDKSEKRDAVLKEFQDFSKNAQSDVLSILQAEERSSQVVDIKCHWLTNMINCKTNGNVIYKLSQHPDVAAIAYNKTEYLLFDEVAQVVEPQRGMTENIGKINADDVWKLGYTGKDVIVAILDSGVNINHVDLKNRLWDGGDSYPNHGYNTMENSHDITDRNGHGTHCAGTICGDGTSGTQSGIAPDATLMVIKILGDDGSGSTDAIVSGIEFAIEHDADIINISAGFTYPNVYVSNLLRHSFENALEFDVIGAVAAGNERRDLSIYPIPRNISCPGNCPPPWLHPDQHANAGGLSSVISVGAVNYNDKKTDFSSEGPVTWVGGDWNDYVLDMTSDIDKSWLFYDNNYFELTVGGPKSFRWGIMLPPEKLQNYPNGQLTKIAMFDYVYHLGNIEIYQGGDTPNTGTMIHTEPFTCLGTNSWVEFELTAPITVDATQNLWVVLQTNDGEFSPVAACAMTDDPNGRWIKNNVKWVDNTKVGINKTWMIRAYITNYNGEGPVDDKSNDYGLIRPDVCAPGVGIVSCAHDNNTGFLSLNGTSMATPCVAGAIALMLEKRNDLTPAQICEILETTAVKLSDKKNNRTGSGRIDILAAINKIDELPETLPELEENLNIYPNPVESHLCINTIYDIKKVNIYNVIGNIVYSKENNMKTIDVSKLNSGVYFIEIETANDNIIQRFIKK